MKKGFTLIEIMIVVTICALLAAIAIPNLLRAKCEKEKELGICSDACNEYFQINKDSIKKENDNIEVFCKLMGVDISDYKRSESLQKYYEEFKRGSLDLSKLKK